MSRSPKAKSGALSKVRFAISLSNVNPLDREYKKRFTIKVGQHLKIIAISEIECFCSENKATYIYTKENRNYLIDTTLEQLDANLNPIKFFRVNRKCTINIEAIKDIKAQEAIIDPD